MPDLDLDWGGDLVVSPSGDIATVDGDKLTQQRIIRRLFTAIKGYIFHPDYGAGLLQKIGGVIKAANVQAIVRSQIALEASVAKTPLPTTTVVENPAVPGAQIITITYFNDEGQQQQLTFDTGATT